MEVSWWERLTEGETESCSDGRGHAQSIAHPVFCWWVGLCSLPTLYLGPNYGGGNEDTGELPQKIPCTAALIAPNPAAGHHQTIPPPETPGHPQASPWQCPLGHCSFLLGPGAQDSVVPSKVYLPVLRKFWQLYGGLMEISSKRLMPYPDLRHPEPLAPQQSTADPYLLRRHPKTSA